MPNGNSPTPGFIAHSRSFVELLARWGAAQLGQLGPLFAAVLPVVVVDRFRGPDEGNIWVITAETAGALGEHSAVGIVSSDPLSDFELLSVTVNQIPVTVVSFQDYSWHICTPLASAVNPVANNTLVGFVPGVITDLPVTFSPLTGFSGTAAGLVLPLGEIHRQIETSVDQFANTSIAASKTVDFDPPLRIYGAGRAVVVQSIDVSNVGSMIALGASFRFRVRPRRASL